MVENNYMFMIMQNKDVIRLLSCWRKFIAINNETNYTRP